MDIAVKRTLLAALAQYRGDNLERAQAAFQYHTPAEMQQLYGFSGSTRQALLDGYRKHASQVDAAVKFVKTLPVGGVQ